MMKNKMLIVVMIVSMLIIIGLFSFFNTLEGDGSQAQTYTFATSTPTPDLVGNGWWNTMPTPIKVETND